MNKPKLNLPDTDLRHHAECAVLSPILRQVDSLAGSRLIGTLLGTLRPPLAKWFKSPANRTLAVALDAHLRGEIDCDQGAVANYLSAMPHATLHEIFTGGKVSAWKACDYEGSALQFAGGFTSAFPDHEKYLDSQALGYAEILRGLVQQENTIDALRKMAVDVSKADVKKGADHVIAGVVEQLTALLSSGNDKMTMGDALAGVVAAAKRAAEMRRTGESSLVSWGIPELDKFCPLRPGALVILSAPPGAGKTSLALMAASATAAAGGRGSVALVSLEMTINELVTILCAREIGISPSAIRDWRPAAEAEEAQILALAQKWRESDGISVRESETGARHTASAVTAWLRKRKRVSCDKLTLGVVDYIGLLESEGKEGEREKLAAASGLLKSTAQSLEIPILCLAQLNREGRKAVRDPKTGKAVATPEPRKEDLAGSGALEANADAIVFIHFPDAATDDPMPRGKIIVAKQRGGATGSIDVIFHRSHQLFMFEPPVKNTSMSESPNESEDLYG